MIRYTVVGLITKEKFFLCQCPEFETKHVYDIDANNFYANVHTMAPGIHDENL
jgi:hypothetical protein